MPLQPVILSGGSGTRLWPLSREAYPKQFLPLTRRRTMFQETVRRLDGDAFVQNARDNLIVAQHRMVAAVGVNGLIVVETPDAVLVADEDSTQDVKAVTQFLKREQRSERRHRQRMHRPWGNFDSIRIGERYQVKRLTVNPGESHPLQMHHHRAEGEN